MKSVARLMGVMALTTVALVATTQSASANCSPSPGSVIIKEKCKLTYVCIRRDDGSHWWQLVASHPVSCNVGRPKFDSVHPDDFKAMPPSATASCASYYDKWYVTKGGKCLWAYN